MNLEKKIKQEIDMIKEQLVEWRRDIHQHPELGFAEKRTSSIIVKLLKEWDLEVEQVAGTGVVGLLEGGVSSCKTIAIRADMDALPLEEDTNLPCSSVNKNIMHACGHDGHTAITLGTAHVLSKLKDNLPGNIKFIFQPAEEGPGGAKPMIEAGVLANPQVDMIIGLHIWPMFHSGEVGFKSGTVMAATDKFIIRIIGKGTHGAHPDQGVDPVVIGSHLVLALQDLVSREIDPLEPVVITCGSFHAGSANNIIPEEAVIEGTVRTLSSEIRQFIYHRIKEVTAGITGAMGAEHQLVYEFGYPATVNDADITEQIRQVAINTLGAKAVKEVTRISMGGEDFAYFLEKVPGAMFFLGTRNPEKGIIYPAHSPHYNFDEDILPIGVELFCRSAFRLLK